MAVSVILAARTAYLNDIVARLDAGANALVRWYSGTPPASVDAALSSNPVVAEFILPDPCATVSGETLTFDIDPDIETTSLNGSSVVATFYRVLTSAGVAQLQGTLGAPASGADMIITPSATIGVGQVCRLTTFSHTAPNP
jgi:hypothetical protein